MAQPRPADYSSKWSLSRDLRVLVTFGTLSYVATVLGHNM